MRRGIRASQMRVSSLTQWLVRIGLAQLLITASAGFALAKTPKLAASPKKLNFGTVIVHLSTTKTVTVTNKSSTTAITIESISVPAPFMQGTTNCPTSPNTLAGGAICMIDVGFSPTQAGGAKAVLTINFDGTHKAKVKLAGVGMIGPTPTITTTIVVTPTATATSTATAAATATRTATVTATQTATPTATATPYKISTTIMVPNQNAEAPFKFDKSWVDSANHRLYVSDRTGLSVDVFDTVNDVGVGAVEGDNAVVDHGNSASQCVATIPPLVSALGNFTRFGCKTGSFSLPGIGANGLFGGFPGGQYGTSTGGVIDALSCPCSIIVSADGHTLFVTNASSTVVVFDLTTNPATVIADVPTGQSPDWDGPIGIAACIVAGNGRGFSDVTCADLRASEMSYDETDKILMVANGDPLFPFVTLIDMSAIVARTGNCLPVTPGNPYGPTNFPTCILGQIYYDGAPANNVGVPVDSQSGFPCPDPSTAAPSGVSGTGVGAGGKNVACHHGPIIGGFGAISPSGLGGSAFNSSTGHFLLTNRNATGDLTAGSVDEIDPRIGNVDGPVVIHSFLITNCAPTSIVHGPGTNFLVGCAGHDGEAFAPSEVVINGSTGAVVTTILNIGGVDQIWFNSGDNHYYAAASDMDGGPVLGVIDAGVNALLTSVPTNLNSHSVAVDSSNNQIFVPMEAGPLCTVEPTFGCIAVITK